MPDLATLRIGIPLLSRVHRITLPTPFLVGPVHTYLLEGDPLTLVDAGPDTDDALSALETGLAELGYRLSDLQRIVITHSHVDHYGLAQRVATASGAQVLAHPLARPVLENWPEFRALEIRFAYELLRAAGVPEDLVESTARQFRGYDRFQQPVPWILRWKMGRSWR